MLDRKDSFCFPRIRNLEDILLEAEGTLMKKEKDILEGVGIPPEAIAFFRRYQERQGTAWHMEKNGRFAQNFRHHMLEGLKINIPSLDLLVAAAILLSNHGNYFERVRGEISNDPAVNHDLAVIQQKVRGLAQSMAEWGTSLSIPHSPEFTKVRLRLGLGGAEVSVKKSKRPKQEYIAFLCNLPEIWEGKCVG